MSMIIILVLFAYASVKEVLRSPLKDVAVEIYQANPIFGEMVRMEASASTVTQTQRDSCCQFSPSAGEWEWANH